MSAKGFISEAAAKLDSESLSANNFLKLGRFGGFVNIVIGQNVKLNKPSSKPSLWLEQNAYKTRFVSLGGGISVKASQFKEPSAGFHFPMKRVVEWSNGKALLKAQSFLCL